MPDITLELLRSLGDVPLYRAAERLGMSPSSLKNTCRRLGLARWPRAGWAAAAEGMRAAGARGAGVDVAYARRLYRKYAARDAHLPAGPAAPAGGSAAGAAGEERPFEWDSDWDWECPPDLLGMPWSPGRADSDVGISESFGRDWAAEPAVQGEGKGADD